MTTPTSTGSSTARVIVRGIHLEVTRAMHEAALAKAGHLLTHAARIDRVRIDLELDHTRSTPGRFIAKGRLELRGDDVIATAESEDAYKSLDLLVAKLDEVLRRRHQKRIKTRNDTRRQGPKSLPDEQ